MSSSGGSDPADVFVDDAVVRETMEIEHRLRDAGYWNLPDVLDLAGDFVFDGATVEEIVREARTLLVHQHSVELSGARILASIGQTAVKAAAFDAIAAIVGSTKD